MSSKLSEIFKYFLYGIAVYIFVFMGTVALIEWVQSSKNQLNTNSSQRVYSGSQKDIFLKDYFDDEVESQDKSWSLVITGDIIPARVTNATATQKNDYFWPFEEISPILQSGDITLANLEAPLLENCPVSNVGLVFCGDSRFAQSLSQSGIDIVNIANNHSLNYGWKGLVETQELLLKQNIYTTGYNGLKDTNEYNNNSNNSEGFSSLIIENGEENTLNENIDDVFLCLTDAACSSFYIKEIKGISVGFLGYNGVSNKVNREIVQKQVSQAQYVVDYLVVSVHWGKEYVNAPEVAPGIADDHPVELGHLLVDWGADLVVGNHPHAIQGIEQYRESTIYYALGNTIFDQEWSIGTKRGFLAKIFYDETEIVKTELYPIGIRDWGQAYLLEGEERDEAIRFIMSL